MSPLTQGLNYRSACDVHNLAHGVHKLTPQLITDDGHILGWRFGARKPPIPAAYAGDPD